jgi:hypothetical protein
MTAHPIFILYAVGVCGALFVGYFVWSVRRDLRRTAAALNRIRADPASVTEVQLHENDPISVVVRFADGEEATLADIDGVKAVRKFDAMKLELPAARFAVYRNRREIQEP